MATDLPLFFDPIPYLERCNESWIKYNLKRIQNKENREEFKELTQDPRIKALIDECVMWPDPPIKRHNDAGHPIHKIELLADFGLDIRDEWIKAISNLIQENRSEDGFFLSKIDIPERWGGKGKGELMWLLCDTPLLLYSLKKFGVNNEYTRDAARFLVWNSENNGWRCKGSKPNFRGPGKKEDYCPYANLITLKALSLTEQRDTEAVKNGINSHILHWENRDGKKIYMFGIGTTFKKLKYPNVWYDILHVIDVLSRYPYAREYDTFWEMWEIIKEKQQPEGGFRPESIWRHWSKWSFGQKKEPSPWMTLRILEIAERLK
ncbi:hypothetical protein ACFL0D_04815 [Thermoproteota archaeon]